MAKHRFEIFDKRWAISFSRTGVVPDSEWNEFNEVLMGLPNLECVLGVSVGTASLTSTQRKRTAEILKDRGAMAVVITDDRLTRGIATAVAWMGANVRAYAWSDIEKALQTTGAPPHVADDMRRSILAFRDESTMASAREA